MHKKIISITLCLVFCLSIVFNNSVLSIASDNQDFDYTQFYIKNLGDENDLVEDKYIEIDSKEDYDEMKKYYSNWNDAVKGHMIAERKYDYPFYIRFFAQKNMTHDKVKEMLSKYDTNFLFGYTYPSDYRIKCIKDFLNCTYYEKTYSNRTVKVSNSVINEKFQGTDEQLLELFECIRKDSCYNFIYDSEKISYDDFRYLETIVVVQSGYMINDESRYYVRFNNKEEYLNAIEELKNNEDIFVEETGSSEILELKENSIAVTYDWYDNLGEIYDVEKFARISNEFEKNLLDTIKNDLSDYELNYFEIVKHQKIDNQYILSIENIKEEDLEDICTILYRREERNSSRIEKKPSIRFYVIGDNKCNYTYNVYREVYKNESTDEQNKKTRYKKLYRVQESDGKVYRISGVDGFYISISEDCIIYPMYITKDLGEHSIINKLYNPNTGEHLFVSKSSEYSTLTKNGWKFQRSVFSTDDSKDEDLEEVYRLYNPNVKGGDHHYTMSYNEASNLVKKGWKWDNNAKPVFYSGGDVEVYRLYNKNNGRHYYTKNVGEKNKLVKLGWKYEGVAWTVLE